MLEVIARWLDEAEDQISELEIKLECNTNIEHLHKKRPKKYENRLRVLQDNMK